MKKRLLVALLFVGAAFGQTTQQQCAQAIASPSTQLPATPTCVGTACSVQDSSPVDGAIYAYVIEAFDWAGFSCSNIVTNVVIPATGAHTVGLTFTASITTIASYAAFRAQNPANPTGLTSTVN